MVEAIKTTHPEGLTDAQEKLADLLFETKTHAKVTRRYQLPDGSFKFEAVERDTSPIDFAREGEFALKLHERKPDAPLSPIYINLRNLPEPVLEQVGQVLAEIPGEERPDFCAGIPSAGVPLAKAYSIYSGVPLKEDVFAKAQIGSGRRIVAGGEQEEKGKLRLVDDLVTQADTKFEAIKVAEEFGYEVVDVMVLVDREQGGARQLEEADYKLHAAFTLTQLLNYYLRTGKIDKARYEEVTTYLTAATRI